MHKKFFYFVAVLFAFLIVFGLFLRMVSLTVGLRDSVYVNSNFHKPGLYISEILPLPLGQEAEKKQGVWEMALLGWPAFIDFSPLAVLDFVEARLKYRAAPSVRGVRLGVLVSQKTNEFIVGYSARILEELGWSSEKKDGLLVYGDSSMPKDATRSLGISVPVVPVVSEYAPRSVSEKFHVNLRGHHRFLVYAENEKLKMNFVVQDMNRGEGADSIRVFVTDAVTNEQVFVKEYDDDGNVLSDQKQSGLIDIAVITKDLPRGVYQVLVDMSDDVFIRDIDTTQQKWVVRDRVSLGDVVGYSQTNSPTNLLVYGSFLDVRLEHPRGTQDLQIGDKKLSLAQVSEVVGASLPDLKVEKIVSEKNDVSLVTEGVFGFSESAMFLPILPPMSFFETIESVKKKGIVSIVTAPNVMLMNDIGEVVVGVEMNRMDKTVETGDFRFSIEPIIQSDAEKNGAFLLRDFSFLMQREKTTLFETVFRINDLFDKKWSYENEPFYRTQTYGRID